MNVCGARSIRPYSRDRRLALRSRRHACSDLEPGFDERGANRRSDRIREELDRLAVEKLRKRSEGLRRPQWRVDSARERIVKDHVGFRRSAKRFSEISLIQRPREALS